MRSARDPVVVKWAKRVTVVVGALVILWTTGVATITTGVRMAAAPLVRDESRARQAADSLIVSRLEAMDRKQDILANALMYPDGSAARDALLRLMGNVQPRAAILPPETKVQGKAD